MERENRTNKQVEAFIFKDDPKFKRLFLLMKRVPERGSFWQPLTGGVRAGESLTETLLREIKEETGIAGIVRTIDTGYKFDFTNNNKTYHEFVFGVQVPSNTLVTLSDEHDAYKWVTEEDALPLLKWENNIEGLRQLCLML